MNKKIIYSLCAVSLMSLVGGAIGPSISIHADAQPVTTKPTDESKDKESTTTPSSKSDDKATTTETGKTNKEDDTSKSSSSATTDKDEENNKFAGTVDLVDADGKVLGQTSTLSGKYGDHVSITLPTGYVSAINGATTVDYILNKDKTPIKIKKASEQEMVRTIKIHKPDGSVQTINQTAKKDGKFIVYKIPEIKYYKASTNEIPAAKATEDNGKTIDVSYKKILPDWTVGVKGYTVLQAGTLTRTIRFVDESGKEVAPAKVESVQREVLVKNSGLKNIYPKTKENETAASAEPAKTVDKASLSTAINQKDETKQETKDADEYLVLTISGKNAIISSPTYRLTDVNAPKVKGMKLKDEKMSQITGQYLWLGDPNTLSSNPTLENGFKKYLDSNETIDITYVKDDKAAANGEKDQNNKDKNGTTATNQGGEKDTNNSDKANAKSATQPVGVGLSSSTAGGAVLPQTGNRPTNWLLLTIGSALAALGFTFADKIKQRK